MEYLKQSVLKYFDPELADILKEHGGYLAGGCFTSLATNTPINDYDIYFKSKEALLEAIQYCEDDVYYVSFVSDKSVSLSHKAYRNSAGEAIKLQFIYYNFYDAAWDIFKNFDFTINMCAYSFHEDKIVSDKDFFLRNSQRFLKFNPYTDFPILSALRVKKYEDRGYKISKREYLKVMMAVSSLSLTSWEDLYKHIGGLYGMTYARKEQIVRSTPYSLEAALEVLEGLDFSTEGKESEKWSWDTLHKVLSGEEILYTTYGEGSEQTAVEVFEIDGKLSIGKKIPLIGNILYTPLQDVLGPYLFKYVTEDLRSKAWDYQYHMGEWNTAADGRVGHRTCNGTFYMNKKQKEPQWSSYGNTIIKCEYDPKDIVDMSSSYIRIKRVKPVYALQEIR